MPTKPFVSVVVPAFNHAGYVSQTIGSVLAQTFRDWELIVIDDGSTDDTGKAVDAFGPDPRIHIIHQRNRGLSRTLNRGLKLCQGTYFSFLPSDDYLHPRKIEAQVAAIEADPDLDIVFCDQVPVDAAGAEIHTGAIATWAKVPYTHSAEILPALFERNFIPAPSALVRTDALRNAGGFDESLVYAQDYDLWLRLLPRCHALWLHEPLLYYRWHGKNLTFGSQEPVHVERAYLTTKALADLRIEDIYPHLRELPEHTCRPETAKRCLELADRLADSGVLEMLPWAEVFVQQARRLAPRVRTPKALLAKLSQRTAFMDCRDSRLQMLAGQVGNLGCQMDIYREQVPDILAERRELTARTMQQNQRDRQMEERERSLNEWNRSLEGREGDLNAKQRDLEAREDRVVRFMNRLPVRLATRGVSAIRSLRAGVAGVWHRWW